MAMPPSPGRRASLLFPAALLASTLAHVVLLAGIGPGMTLPEPPPMPPLQARLVQPPAPTSAPVRAVTPARAAPPPIAAPAAVQPEPPAATPVASDSPAQPAPAEPPPAEPPPAESPPAEPPPEPAPAAPQAPLAQRSLAQHLVLVYQVQHGDDGLVLGRVTYTWQQDGARYRLVSVAEATGVVALFVSGKIVQTSAGEIDAHGLRPAEFWMARGERRREQARFDWTAMQLFYAQGGEPLRALSQDVLSFPFHLAMTVAADKGEWLLPVTNGRRLRDYHFSVRGPVTLELGAAHLETLHLQGTHPEEGRLDVWLDQDWLPLRMRTENRAGEVTLLTRLP